MFTLYVDADSCPKNLRTILLRRIMKDSLAAFFVADRPLKDVQLAYEQHTASLRSEAKKQGIEEVRSITSSIVNIVVPPNTDSADDWIVEHAAPPCLAITHDIPLAARLVEKGIPTIDDRGGIFTPEEMAERLSMRNAMKEFREMGIFSEKHKPMGPKETKAFSDTLDTMLHKLVMKQ